MADNLEIVNGGTPPNERCMFCGSRENVLLDRCRACRVKHDNLLNLLPDETRAALEKALRAGVAVGTIVSPTCRILQGAMGIADAVEQCTVA